MILQAHDLSVTRSGALVLDDIAATLLPGQITAICGPNGAGKSSLILTLAGLLPAMAGGVSLDKRDIASLHPKDRAKAIGYLPQSAEIAWDVAVENIVALGRMPRGDGGSQRGEDAIQRAIDALALSDLRRRPASKLSGGEQARVLLARVLAGEPQWILADEPLAALDLAHQTALTRHFRTAAAAGKGVVLVVHDLAQAMNHAGRVLVLDQGQLVADGAPEDALTSETIAKSWGVQTKWIGEPGTRALITV